MLVNLTNGKAEAEFTKYVKPLEDYVSWYCEQQTGIKYTDVSHGESLEKLLDSFQLWLEDLRTKKKIRISKNTYFLCWSNTEFDKTLRDETKKKKIKLPEVFLNPKICVKKNFLLHAQLPTETNIKCAAAMKHVAMNFKKNTQIICGNQMRNASRLAVKLAKLGVTFELDKPTESK